MELCDIRIQVSRGRREIRMSKPQRHRVHRIAGLYLPRRRLMPKVVKPKATDAGPPTRIRPCRLDVPNPCPCVSAPHVIVWPVRLPRWMPLPPDEHLVQRRRNRNPPRSFRLRLRAGQIELIPGPVDLLPLEG